MSLLAPLHKEINKQKKPTLTSFLPLLLNIHYQNNYISFYPSHPVMTDSSPSLHLLKMDYLLLTIHQMTPILTLLLALTAIPANQEFHCDDPEWKREPRQYLNPREILAPTAHGFSLVVDSADQVVSESILQTGTWQPQLLFLIATLIDKADNIINLGAQLGLQAIAMSRLATSGRLYVFEPYSVSYRMLVKSIYLNGLDQRTTAFRLAAGARAEELKLKIDAYNTGHSHIHYGPPDDAEEFESVRVQRVDTVVPREMIFNFALIDVETHEVEALLGMREILTRSPSLIILLEWSYLSNSYRSEGQAQSLIELVNQLKFRWVRYTGGERCKIGTFSQLDPHQLLAIKTEDLLLVGPEVDVKAKFGIDN